MTIIAVFWPTGERLFGAFKIPENYRHFLLLGALGGRTGRG